METTTPRILITGATGKTGRRVADRLAAAGVPIRAGSRRATPPFDWEDRSTWAPALDGCTGVYLAYQPDLAVPGADATVGAFARLAVEQGARRIVLLSGRGEEGALRSEQAVLDSGADVTIVRASWFAQNFSEGYLADPVRAGVIALPTGTVPEPFVDADDIADIAAAAFLDDRHAGRLYEVTGPRLMTLDDVAADLSAATGREIRFASVSPDEYRALCAEHGVPADVAEIIIALFAEVLDGRNASLAGGVEEALGRPPKDFAAFAREEAAAGTWSAPAAAPR